MPFKIVPASEVPLPEQARLANAGFANYVGGWKELDASGVARFLTLQGTDLYYSRLLANDDGLVGFGYIGRVGDVLRLSGMAIVPEARGTGAAGYLLTQLFDEARARGDATMMLEVIEQNPRAIALYRRHGFREVGRLVGWRRKAGQAPAGETELEAIPTLEALRWPSLRDYPDLPSQISRYNLAKVERTTAFRSGEDCIVISQASPATYRVHAIFSPRENWTALRGALAAIMTRYGDGEFFAPPIWPEDFGRELFEPLGFTREAISQFLMRLDFSS